MAGRARLQALTDELSKRALDTFDVDPIDITLGTAQRPTHLDYVCAWMERGQTVKALAADLSTALTHIEITYDALMRYLRSTFGQEETERAISTARVRASHAMAETALELVDAKAETQIQVSQAASQARSRQWMAERYNPKDFGSQKGATVSISITSLHLSALQAPHTIVTGALPSAQQPSALPSGQPIQVVEQQ